MTGLLAADVLDALAGAGVTDLIGLPDNASAALFAAAASDPRVRLVSVTREGEAFAIASGLWMGGREPAVVCQNTGLLESGDSLRGTAIRMGLPLVMLITYRGYASLARRPEDEADDLLVRPDVDSVAVMTGPTLAAWGVPWELLEEASGVAAALDQARAQSRPVARLVTSRLG